MPKSSKSLESINAESLLALDKLGQRLRANRIQLGWTVNDIASRLFCSPATYSALEAGKPGTSIGILANALWLLGVLDSLNEVAPAPAELAAGRRVRRKAGKDRAGVISADEREF